MNSKLPKESGLGNAGYCWSGPRIYRSNLRKKHQLPQRKQISMPEIYWNTAVSGLFQFQLKLKIISMTKSSGVCRMT